MNEPYEVKETWTNLAYLTCGFVIFWLHGNIHYSLSLITLAVGSYYFHRTKSHVLFDWYGIVYVLMTASMTLSDSRLFTLFCMAYMGLYGFFVMGKIGVNIEILIPSLITISTLYQARGFYPTLITVLYFTFCLFIRSKDCGVRQDIFHDSWGHSFWHILTAIGFYFLVYG